MVGGEKKKKRRRMSGERGGGGVLPSWTRAGSPPATQRHKSLAPIIPPSAETTKLCTLTLCSKKHEVQKPPQRWGIKITWINFAQGVQRSRNPMRSYARNRLWVHPASNLRSLSATDALLISTHRSRSLIVLPINVPIFPSQLSFKVYNPLMCQPVVCTSLACYCPCSVLEWSHAKTAFTPVE